MKRDIALVAHNIRSSHNIGALFRLADGLAINRLLLSGYSPYPLSNNDQRLPHLAKKIDSQIQKTALGAELNVPWQYQQDVNKVIRELKKAGYHLVGLEQSARSIQLNDYAAPDKVAIFVGNEVTGLEQDAQDSFDDLIEIPMLGKKESHNVVSAAAIALYQLRFS